MKLHITVGHQSGCLLWAHNLLQPRKDSRVPQNLSLALSPDQGRRRGAVNQKLTPVNRTPEQSRFTGSLFQAFLSHLVAMSVTKAHSLNFVLFKKQKPLRGRDCSFTVSAPTPRTKTRSPGGIRALPDGSILDIRTAQERILHAFCHLPAAGAMRTPYALPCMPESFVLRVHSTDRADTQGLGTHPGDGGRRNTQR